MSNRQAVIDELIMGRPLHHGRGAVAPAAGYRKHKKHTWGG